MKGSINRSHDALIVEASPREGVGIHGNVRLSWKEWAELVEYVQKQWKQLIQVHFGNIIPGDTVNGRMSTKDDWYKDINCIDEVVREDKPGWYQVTEGTVKPGDICWSALDDGSWQDVSLTAHNKPVGNFYRVLRRI